MKTILVILCGLILAVGCSRQSSNQPAAQPNVQYETLTLDWLIENQAATDLGFTNHCLDIITDTDTKTNSDYTDVYSLEDTANILGKYGWYLVAVGNDGMHETWYMERQARADKKRFALVEASVAQVKSWGEEK